MSGKKKVFIVEDDMIIAADISMQVTEMGFEVAGMSTNGEDAVKIIAVTRPDIILMDIILSGEMNGVETSKVILDKFKTPVIFLTSNYDDATFQKALGTQPYGFIAKPFQFSELERALKITVARIENEGNDTDHHQVSTMEDRLFIRHNDRMVKVFIEDILYVEADRNYCKVITATHNFVLAIPMSKFIINLPSDFFIRTHRSFLVNASKIDSVSANYESFTIGEHTLPISRRQKEEVVAKLKLI